MTSIPHAFWTLALLAAACAVVLVLVWRLFVAGLLRDALWLANVSVVRPPGRAGNEDRFAIVLDLVNRTRLPLHVEMLAIATVLDDHAARRAGIATDRFLLAPLSAATFQDQPIALVPGAANRQLDGHVAFALRYGLGRRLSHYWRAHVSFTVFVDEEGHIGHVDWMMLPERRRQPPASTGVLP